MIRGEDSHVLGTAAAALLGLGIGIGVGLLLAPASGEETRSNIASKARDIRDRVSSRAEAATGTYGRSDLGHRARSGLPDAMNLSRVRGPGLTPEV